MFSASKADLVYLLLFFFLHLLIYFIVGALTILRKPPFAKSIFRFSHPRRASGDAAISGIKSETDVDFQMQSISKHRPSVEIWVWCVQPVSSALSRLITKLYGVQMMQPTLKNTCKLIRMLPWPVGSSPWIKVLPETWHKGAHNGFI